jgi:hypothetical protein
MLSSGLALTTIFVKVGEPGIFVINPLACTLGRLVNRTQQREYYPSSNWQMFTISQTCYVERK